LTKRCAGVAAVSDVSFAVRVGEIVGYPSSLFSLSE